MKTLARTLWIWRSGQAVARRVTEVTDHTFIALGSGTVKDFGGDPAEWKVATSDYVTSVSQRDTTDGFQLVKGTCSVNRLEAASHAWKEITTLGEFVKLDHPLNKGAGTIEEIRKAYDDLRAEVDAA